jgi:hypothetical protein
MMSAAVTYDEMKARNMYDEMKARNMSDYGDVKKKVLKQQQELPADPQEALLVPGFGRLVSDPEALVSELVAATNYARAAYGYVLAAGHMSSISR